MNIIKLIILIKVDVTTNKSYILKWEIYLMLNKYALYDHWVLI